MATAQDYVSAGISKVSPVRPNWYNEVDPSKVNISSTKDCICGQLFGDYGNGLKILEISTPSEYGFNLPFGLDFVELNAAWREAIEERRKADVKVPALV